MISICGSVSKSPINVKRMVRYVLDRASKPDEIEFVFVHDDADYDQETGVTLQELKKEGINLQIISILREEKIEYIQSLLNFYVHFAIFPEEDIKDMSHRLNLFKKGELASLWIGPGRNHNIAVEHATSDIIIISPLDMLYEFDVSLVEKKVRAEFNDSPFNLFFGSNEGTGYVRLNHGMRVFNKNLFNRTYQTDTNYSTKPFAFDPRWMIRPLYEDVWNEKIKAFTGGWYTWEDVFKEQYNMTPLKNEHPVNYLTSKMLANMDNNNYYMQFIQAYWDKYKL